MNLSTYFKLFYKFSHINMISTQYCVDINFNSDKCIYFLVIWCFIIFSTHIFQLHSWSVLMDMKMETYIQRCDDDLTFSHPISWSLELNICIPTSNYELTNNSWDIDFPPLPAELVFLICTNINHCISMIITNQGVDLFSILLHIRK